MKSESGLQRGLSITYTDGIPKFHFTGDWTGKDIAVIVRMIPREYHIHVRALRRSVVQPVIEEVSK
jgi:hypothetical protein